MLLTAANLAQIHNKTKPSITKEQNIKYYLEQTNGNAILSLPDEKVDKKPDPDNLSLASSMHFTIVNVNTRPTARRSFCRRNQITILVVTMSVVFSIGIFTAVLLLESM